MAIVILGGGDIGYHLALTLSRENREVVIVESDSVRADRIDEDENDIQVVRGNAADPGVLIAAGLRKAHLLVAVTNSDEVNIVACFLAARMAPKVRRVARIRQLDTRLYGHLLVDEPPVIHSIINPEELCARKIADLIRYRGATEVNWSFDKRVAIVAVPIKEGSPVQGKTLVEIGRWREQLGLPLLIAMIVRDQEARVPDIADVMQYNDLLHVVTLSGQLDDVLDFFCGSARRERFDKIAVYGGSNIGLYLAEILEEQGVDIRLVESDAGRAAELAERLNHTLVLCGEPFEKNIFAEEKIGQMDAFVAATQDQEDNIISALYAKTCGIPLSVAVLYREQMARLVYQVGIDATILPRLVAIGEILGYVRGGNVASVVVLNQNDREIIEYHIEEGSGLAGRPLRQVHIPGGGLLLAVERSHGETIIPNGGTTIEPGDRIALIAARHDQQDIDRMLSGSKSWWRR